MVAVVIQCLKVKQNAPGPKASFVAAPISYMIFRIIWHWNTFSAQSKDEKKK
jgi:hypothetical protein